MAKRKPKDPPLDELIRQLVRCARRIEDATGGYVHFRMEFGPKEPQLEITSDSALTQPDSEGQ